MREAIIDNTALNYLAHLSELIRQHRIAGGFDIISALTEVIRVIHVPLAVKNEFASSPDLSVIKERLRDTIEQESGGFRSCQQYDSVVLASLTKPPRPGIDAGEAEAVAQSQKISVGWFITDDLDCVKELTKLGVPIRFLDTLALLAAVDLIGFLPSRDEVLRLFFTMVRPAQKGKVSRLLRQAYIQVGSLYGVTLTKRQLGAKTSAKSILSHGI